MNKKIVPLLLSLLALFFIACPGKNNTPQPTGALKGCPEGKVTATMECIVQNQEYWNITDKQIQQLQASVDRAKAAGSTDAACLQLLNEWKEILTEEQFCLVNPGGIWTNVCDGIEQNTAPAGSDSGNTTIPREGSGLYCDPATGNCTDLPPDNN